MFVELLHKKSPHHCQARSMAGGLHPLLVTLWGVETQADSDHGSL
jgi:hypothetical protein